MTPAEHRDAMYSLCIAHITSPAEGRMRLRTAKEQHAAALAELQRATPIGATPRAEPDTAKPPARRRAAAR